MSIDMIIDTFKIILIIEKRRSQYLAMIILLQEGKIKRKKERDRIGREKTSSKAAKN
jgi:hypothetical protein